MEACIAANGDKDDPSAFCASLMHETEKLVKEHRKTFGIAKVDEASRQVFGWVSVSEGPDGTLLEDLQGDLIDPPELEKAVYDFVLYGGGANEMHQGRMKGQLIESVFIDPDKLKAMKLKTDGAPRSAWWAGFKLEPDAFEKVKAGQYKMFSIKGQHGTES